MRKLFDGCLVALLVLSVVVLLLMFIPPIFWKNSPVMKLNVSLGCDPDGFGPCDAFRDYIESRFPKGSPEQTLVVELEKDGFRLSPTPYFKGYDHDYVYQISSSIACALYWRVDFQSNQRHELTAVTADYQPVCL